MSDLRLPITPDRLRLRDRRALRRPAAMEKREILEKYQVTETLSLIESRVTTEIWHFHGDSFFPEGIVFNVRGIKDDIASGKIASRVSQVQITPTWYEHLLKNGGIEQERLVTLKREDLRRIAVGILMPDDTLMIIDGNHRIVRRYQEGLTSVRVVIAHWMQCMQHEVKFHDS